MIIELRIIHAKWMVLIGDTCTLRANRNETMWNTTEFGMYGRDTNRWKTNYMGGIDVAKLIVTGDGGRETNHTQNGPCNLPQAYPAWILLPAA
jgi:hypothetical protein